MFPKTTETTNPLLTFYRIKALPFIEESHHLLSKKANKQQTICPSTTRHRFNCRQSNLTAVRSVRSSGLSPRRTDPKARKRHTAASVRWRHSAVAASMSVRVRKTAATRGTALAIRSGKRGCSSRNARSTSAPSPTSSAVCPSSNPAN